MVSVPPRTARPALKNMASCQVRKVHDCAAAISLGGNCPFRAVTISKSLHAFHLRVWLTDGEVTPFCSWLEDGAKSARDLGSYASASTRYGTLPLNANLSSLLTTADAVESRVAGSRVVWSPCAHSCPLATNKNTTCWSVRRRQMSGSQTAQSFVRNLDAFIALTRCLKKGGHLVSGGVLFRLRGVTLTLQRHVV